MHGVDALGQLTLHPEPGAAEDPDHRVVVGQDEGAEGVDPERPGVRGEVLEQPGTDTVPLIGIGHCECDLGGFAAGLLAVVAADADDDVVALDHEGHPVGVVEHGEVLELIRIEALLHTEEPVVHALAGHARQQAVQSVAVVRADGPQANGRTVFEEDVRLPLGGVAGGHGERRVDRHDAETTGRSAAHRR